ncbi:MAG: desulfoferrodoxin family protein [Methylococcales bacterium]|nr:desulfoferrodoxin family protein [Methylococcales bacterium]
MKRRDFIRLSVASTGLGLISPAALAQAEKQLPAGADIYFTKDAPGHWAGKSATHVPVIEISKTGDSASLKITTPHEMKGYEHYIVKHVLLDKNYKFIDEHMFDPTKDSVAISNFLLKNYTGKVYALSMCNKHDLWVDMAEI